MRQYYENIDDYTDTRPSKVMELTKKFLPVAIFIGSMILGTCGHLEVL